MRRVTDIDAWDRRTRELLPTIVAEVAEPPRTVRRKPRSPEKHAVLERAALAEIDQARASGRIERLGPRRYRVSVPRAATVADQEKP